jgi:hypothetical protein
VRLALQAGAPLVPVVVFQERSCYRQGPLGSRLGRWGSLLPWEPAQPQQGLGVVFGSPLPCQQLDNPSPQQVAALHADFCAALQELWHRHKRSFGYAEGEALLLI